VRARRVPTVIARAAIVAIAIATASALAHRLWDLPWWLVAALAAAAFLAAATWSLTRPVGLGDVARLLDTQLGLDEQIATAVSLDHRAPANQGLRVLLAQRAAGLAAPRAGDRVSGVGWRPELWPAVTVAALFALVVLVPDRSAGSSATALAPPGRIAAQPPATGQAAPHLHLRVATTGTQPSSKPTTSEQGTPALHSSTGTTKGTGVRPSAQAAAPWLHQHVSSETGARGTATTPQSGLKPGSGKGAETGQAAKTQTSKAGKADKPPIGQIAAPGQDRNGNPAVGAATRESSGTAKTVPKNAIQSPYGGAAAKQTQQQGPGLVVGKNVGGTGGFGNGSAGTGRAGKAGQAAGAGAAGAKSGFQLSTGNGQRGAPGVRNSAPNAKTGTRSATSDKGAGVTTYVPPDGAAVPAEDRGLVRAAHPLPATGARRTP
jgi:hypothetical protein